MTPIFSIITPSYNKALYIENMIASVVAQTESNWELIIIDDGSTDGTAEKLTELKKADERIKLWLNAENRGANYRRNEGIKHATGQYIIFLDADDLMMDFCLEQRRKQIEQRPKADLWVFNMGLFKQTIGDVSSSKYWIAPVNRNNFLSNFLKHQIPWAIMQTTWNNQFLQESVQFDPSFREFDDVEIHTSAILKGARVLSFPNLPVDVYYCIDENRKGKNINKRLKTIVAASKSYYNKYFDKVNNLHLKKALTGTLFQTLSMLCWQLRKRKISKTEFLDLKAELINTCKFSRHKKRLNAYQKLCRTLPFHLPGLKKLFSFLLSV